MDHIELVAGTFRKERLKEQDYRRASETCDRCGAVNCVVYFTRADGNQCEKCWRQSETETTRK